MPCTAQTPAQPQLGANGHSVPGVAESGSLNASGSDTAQAPAHSPSGLDPLKQVRVSWGVFAVRPGRLCLPLSTINRLQLWWLGEWLLALPPRPPLHMLESRHSYLACCPDAHAS